MRKNKRTSKFIREYGMTLEKLAKKYNHNKSYLWILHQRGELHDFIKDQDKKPAAAGKK